MIKVLLITSPKITGLNYHRQLVPFSNLDSIEAVAYNVWDENWTDEYLKEFQVVSFLRTIDLNGGTEERVKRIKSLGLKF